LTRLSGRTECACEFNKVRNDGCLMFVLSSARPVKPDSGQSRAASADCVSSIAIAHVHCIVRSNARRRACAEEDGRIWLSQVDVIGDDDWIEPAQDARLFELGALLGAKSVRHDAETVRFESLETREHVFVERPRLLVSVQVHVEQGVSRCVIQASVYDIADARAALFKESDPARSKQVEVAVERGLPCRRELLKRQDCPCARVKRPHSGGHGGFVVEQCAIDVEEDQHVPA